MNSGAWATDVVGVSPARRPGEGARWGGVCVGIEVEGGGGDQP